MQEFTELQSSAQVILGAFVGDNGEGVEVMTLQPAQNIYSEGETSRHVYILLEGTVKIAVMERNKEKIISLLEPGEIFGWISTMDEQAQPSSAIAFNAVTVARISNQDLLERLHNDPLITFRLINNAASQLRKAYREIKGMTFSYQISQMAQQLWELYQRFPGDEEGRRYINLTLNQQTLGDLLGIARETATKLMNTLKGSEVIRVKNQRVWILDATGLQEWIAH